MTSTNQALIMANFISDVQLCTFQTFMFCNFVPTSRKIAITRFVTGLYVFGYVFLYVFVKFLSGFFRFLCHFG
jgi:hypothetical protein